MTPEDQAAFEAAFLRTFTFPEISDQLTFKLGFQAALAHRDAHITQLEWLGNNLGETLREVLEWDRQRKFIVPYRVRDPIRHALTNWAQRNKQQPVQRDPRKLLEAINTVLEEMCLGADYADDDTELGKALKVIGGWQEQTANGGA